MLLWNGLQPVRTSLHWTRIDGCDVELAAGVINRHKVARFDPQHARKPVFDFNNQEPALYF